MPEPRFPSLGGWLGTRGGRVLGGESQGGGIGPGVLRRSGGEDETAISLGWNSDGDAPVIYADSSAVSLLAFGDPTAGGGTSESTDLPLPYEGSWFLTVTCDLLISTSAGTELVSIESSLAVEQLAPVVDSRVTAASGRVPVHCAGLYVGDGPVAAEVEVSAQEVAGPAITGTAIGTLTYTAIFLGSTT